jgi:hypothetical protein
MPYERIEESIQIQSDHIQAGGRGITLGAKQNVAPEYDLYYYPNSFARAIADDLAQTGVFKEVKYSADPSTKGDLELTGVVNATPINKACTSYMLGLPGVLLWFLPIPMAKTTATIDVDLILRETASDQILWQGKLDERVKRYITLYTASAMVYGRSGAFSFNLETPPRKSQVDRHSLFSWHFEALRRSMDNVKPQMISALGK